MAHLGVLNYSTAWRRSGIPLVIVVLVLATVVAVQATIRARAARAKAIAAKNQTASSPRPPNGIYLLLKSSSVASPCFVCPTTMPSNAFSGNRVLDWTDAMDTQTAAATRP